MVEQLRMWHEKKRAKARLQYERSKLATDPYFRNRDLIE
jgi:hypothetical protein